MMTKRVVITQSLGRASPTTVAAALFAVLGATLALAGEEITVIKAGRVITVIGEEFSPGIIVLEGEKVTAVGKGIEYPPSAKTIDARNETVMPGFVLPRSRHGLDGYTRFGVQGDQLAASEVFLNKLDFTDLLEAGYTTVAFIPDGSDIPGVASVFRTGGAAESRKLSDAAFLQIAPDWNGKGKENLRSAFKKAKEEIEKVEKARKEWEEKQKAKKEKAKPEEPKKEGEGKQEKKESKQSENDDENGDRKSVENPNAAEPPTAKAEPPEAEPPKEEKFEPPTIDPKYQPLVDLIQKKDGSRIVVQLTKASDLLHFDDAMTPYEGLPHSFYLATAMSSDYGYIVEKLAARKARVVLRPWIHRLPQTTFRYNLAADLARRDCEVSMIPHDGTREEYLRLRPRIADLVRSGLTRKAAIESLTINPARILGLDKKLGGIEKEREADFVFLDGDPLDPFSRVTRVMILGQFVEMKRKP